jgi:hypothetical protein
MGGALTSPVRVSPQAHPVAVEAQDIAPPLRNDDNVCKESGERKLCDDDSIHLDPGHCVSPSSESLKVFLDACKTGSEEAVLTSLLEGVDPLTRDSFDNIPVYYCCLYGHIRCCAWLLIRMRATGRVLTDDELLRCTTNALTLDIKRLMTGAASPHGKQYHRISIAVNYVE